MERYEQIFKRKSTREYSMEPLAKETLERVRQLLSDTPNLFADLAIALDVLEDGDAFYNSIPGVLSAYTKIRAPHYVVVSSREAPGFRQAAGYSIAHVVLALNSLGLGSCICSTGVDQNLLARHMTFLPDHHPVILIAFGSPLHPEDLYATPGYYKRRSIRDMVLKGPVKRKYAFLFEAARLAPSSYNTQPWRFLVEGDRIHVARIRMGFIKNKLLKSHNKIDMGIVLGYLIISLKAKNLRFKLLRAPFPSEDLEYMITLEILS